MPSGLSPAEFERFSFHVYCPTKPAADAVSSALVAALGGDAAAIDTRNPDERSKRWVVKFDLPNNSAEEARDLLDELQAEVQTIAAAHGGILGLAGFSTLG